MSIQRGTLVHGSDSAEFDPRKRFGWGHYLCSKVEKGRTRYVIGWLNREGAEVGAQRSYFHVRPISKDDAKALHGMWRDMRDARIVRPPPEPPIGEQIRAFLRATPPA
jgi:hypothetical protein